MTYTLPAPDVWERHPQEEWPSASSSLLPFRQTCLQRDQPSTGDCKSHFQESQNPPQESLSLKARRKSAVDGG